MSGRKNIVNGVLYIDAGDMSGDITGEALDVSYLDDLSFQMVWTGTPSGTFYAQVSNDNVTWDNLGHDAISAGGSADSETLMIFQICTKYVRMFFENSSGTGSLNVTYSAKEL